MSTPQRRIPEWTAPESLLPNVLTAVQARSSRPAAGGFFAWSTPRRAAFFAAAAAAVAVTVAGPFRALDFDLVVALVRLQGSLGMWLAVATTLQQVLFHAVSHVLRNPIANAAALGAVGLMMATWVADIQLMHRLLVSNRKGAHT